MSEITTSPKKGLQLFSMLMLFCVLGVGALGLLDILGLSAENVTEAEEKSLEKNTQPPEEIEIVVNLLIDDEIQKLNCTKTNNQIECREDVRHKYRQHSEGCNVLNGDQCWFPFGR